MTAPATAGAYLALRREAQGLTRRQAAQAYAYNPLGADAAEQLLAELESNQAIAGEGVRDRLRTVFRFSLPVYLQMVQGYAPPSLCHDCGCSWNDPCADNGRGCAWADAAATLCTACAAKRAEAA